MVALSKQQVIPVKFHCCDELFLDPLLCGPWEAHVVLGANWGLLLCTLLEGQCKKPVVGHLGIHMVGSLLGVRVRCGGDWPLWTTGGRVRYSVTNRLLSLPPSLLPPAAACCHRPPRIYFGRLMCLRMAECVRLHVLLTRSLDPQLCGWGNIYFSS